MILAGADRITRKKKIAIGWNILIFCELSMKNCSQKINMFQVVDYSFFGDIVVAGPNENREEGEHNRYKRTATTDNPGTHQG